MSEQETSTSSANKDSQRGSRPNIVILFTDDQRYDTIAALGNREVTTPNLDLLVARGTSFMQAHIPSGTVDAVCMPSRAMFHTGRTLFHLEDAGNSIPNDHALLGETLQRAGYVAFGTGKWHNGPASYARSFTDGGEVMFGGMADHWNVPMCDWDPRGKYDSYQPYINDPFSSRKVERRRVDHIHFGKHSTDIVVDHTVDFITNSSADRPYFTYTSFLAPHDPRSMPKEYLEMYDADEIALPDNFAQAHPFDYGQTQIRDELLAPYPRDASETRQHIAEYYAMITHLDAGIGRIVNAVRARGDMDNTLFVFAGDNGLACGQHGLMGKQNHYEHSVRVPLILSGPGIPAGETRNTYAYLLDIYPTVCEIAGINTPTSVEGRSLVPSIHSANHQVRDSLYFAYSDLIRSVKDERHKLMLYSHEATNYAQLFDLETDPSEKRNLLAVDPAEAARSTADRLYDLLVEYRDEWEDTSSSWGATFWGRFKANGGLDGAVRAMNAGTGP